MTEKQPQKTIIAAFLDAQKSMGAATKAAKSHHGHYADLSMCISVIKPALNDAGLVFTQPLGWCVSPDGNIVHYLDTIIYHTESGESMNLGQTIVYCQRPNDPQAYGTGITYAKRYGLCAAFGLPTEDDDGNAASKPAPKQKRKPAYLPKAEPKEIAEWQQFVMAVEAGARDAEIELDTKKLPGWLWKKYGNGQMKLPVKPSDIDGILNELLKIKHGMEDK